MILYISIVDNFKLATELFVKALRPFEIRFLVSNNLSGKVVSSSPIIFVESFKVIPVSFFVAE